MKDQECEDPAHCPACVSEELASLEHAAIVYIAPDGTMKLFRLDEEEEDGRSQTHPRGR